MLFLFQNGPKHFVLGTITKKEGLGTSLLERLQCSYNTIGRAAKLYALEELNINYICAPGITGLLSNLFYGSSVQSSGHIKVLGCPYKFICSSLEETLQSPSYSEVEASLIIQEVKKLQSSQDVFPDDICIMSPSYMQVQFNVCITLHIHTYFVLKDSGYKEANGELYNRSKYDPNTTTYKLPNAG